MSDNGFDPYRQAAAAGCARPHDSGLAAAIVAALHALRLASDAAAAGDPSAAVRRLGDLQVALVDAFAAASDLSAALLAAPPHTATQPDAAPGSAGVLH